MKDEETMRRMLKTTLLRSAALLAVGLAACDSDEGTGPEPGPAPVASVSVEPKEGVWSGTLSPGQTIELTARARTGEGAELPGGVVAWASADTAVAMVSAAGVVTARGDGTTEVTAEVGGRTGRILVVVAEPAAGVALVAVSPQAAVFAVGEVRQYTARAFDAHGNELVGRHVTWTTESPAVVEVSPSGLARALRSGYGQVTATVDGRSSSVGLTVSAQDAAG
jgi:hypothetical protein